MAAGKPAVVPLEAGLFPAPFGLVMVKLSADVPFRAMLVSKKPLVMVGGATTVSVAGLLAALGPPSFELSVPVMLFLTPAVVPVKLTEIAHVPLAASVPPDKLTEVALAAAVKAPPQLLVAPGAAATCRPAGRHGDISKEV